MLIFLRKAIPLLLISGLLFTACDTPAKKAAAEKAKAPQLPPPPIEVLQKLYENTDFIDYMFDDLSFSVSVGDEKSVRGNIGYLSAKPVLDLNCTKPLGNVYFQSNGEHLIIARSFYGNGCAFFILKDKNNRPLYACEMSDAGKTFFNQIVNRTKATPAAPTDEAPAGK